MKRKNYGFKKMFLVKFTLDGEIERVRIPQNSQEEAEQFFRKSFSPNCIFNEIIDITDIDR